MAVLGNGNNAAALPLPLRLCSTTPLDTLRSLVVRQCGQCSCWQGSSSIGRSVYYAAVLPGVTEQPERKEGRKEGSALRSLFFGLSSRAGECFAYIYSGWLVPVLVLSEVLSSKLPGFVVLSRVGGRCLHQVIFRASVSFHTGLRVSNRG